METRSSQDWWDSIKDDPVKINEWLAKQYRGELQAVRRLRQYLAYFTWPADTHNILRIILKDEANHAHWISRLLQARGVDPQDDEQNAEKRYWSAIELDNLDMEEVLAAGSHAENMRLERIRVLCADDRYPDIQETFKKILVDETFHAAAFTKLASPDALERMTDRHRKGLELLGLEA